MKHYVLKRRYFNEATFGTLHREDGSQVCVIAERESSNNAKGESCIPEGTYQLLPHESTRFGTCYALEAPTLGVTRFGPSLRTHCLIHKANRPSELRGCLAPGAAFGVVGQEWAVINSKGAFNALMKELGGEPATLTIEKD
ncbi:DUF5675 family protein [Enterovibrio norvegicus]|uniref:DUF5675 family protein n=1 Tax=Enterovibrio norvegicus TaxID=188144 RepID=UPI000C823F66|nr:DUF5675 family protein [Enterovibrio norvegicus]PMH59613.1 hypothetical protein BCU62_22205 [Enterovibrio norvegicus]